jgi:hypothetical protein
VLRAYHLSATAPAAGLRGRRLGARAPLLRSEPRRPEPGLARCAVWHRRADVSRAPAPRGRGLQIPPTTPFLHAPAEISGLPGRNCGEPTRLRHPAVRRPAAAPPASALPTRRRRFASASQKSIVLSARHQNLLLPLIDGAEPRQVAAEPSVGRKELEDGHLLVPRQRHAQGHVMNDHRPLGGVELAWVAIVVTAAAIEPPQPTAFGDGGAFGCG